MIAVRKIKTPKEAYNMAYRQIRLIAKLGPSHQLIECHHKMNMVLHQQAFDCALHSFWYKDDWTKQDFWDSKYMVEKMKRGYPIEY